MFTVRILGPNSTSARDYSGFSKREALAFIARGGGLSGQIQVSRIARFPRLYVAQYKSARS